MLKNCWIWHMRAYFTLIKHVYHCKSIQTVNKGTILVRISACAVDRQSEPDKNSEPPPLKPSHNLEHLPLAPNPHACFQYTLHYGFILLEGLKQVRFCNWVMIWDHPKNWNLLIGLKAWHISGLICWRRTMGWGIALSTYRVFLFVQTQLRQHFLV